MTTRERQQVRDLVARNVLLTAEVERLQTEVAYLRRRQPSEPRLIKRLRNRADQQRARAEMWRVRALRRA